MPEAGLTIAKAPARPFGCAKCAGPAHFQLPAFCVDHKRLAGRSACGDLEHLMLAMIVGEEIEIEILADIRLCQQWKLL